MYLDHWSINLTIFVEITFKQIYIMRLMRLITLSVSLLLCSSFIACSDDDNNDNDNLELSVDYLNQSVIVHASLFFFFFLKR